MASGFGVATIYRAQSGTLKSVDSITITTRGIPGGPGPYDDEVAKHAFGSSLALADFDHDGYVDAAIGHDSANAQTGSVTIVRGTRSGFARHGNVQLTLTTKHIPGRNHTYEDFGAAIATLDVMGMAEGIC